MGSVNVDQTKLSQSFMLTEGGPGAGVMRQLHLVRPEPETGIGRTALVLMTVAWLPLFVLCLVEDLLFGRVHMPFFYDIAAHARFLLGVPVLVLADVPVGTRLHAVVRHFIEAHLVREKETGEFEAILVNLLRFRDSHIGEVVVVVLTYLATVNALFGASASALSGTWFRPEAGPGLTVVGYWYAFISLPIFQFLLFRWIYRMAVWSVFLWKVSRLNLVLTPTHPDGAGGLAFLGKALIPFGVILFGISTVVSSGVLERILYEGARLQAYLPSYVILFGFALAIFAAPLLIFVPKLLALKARGLMEYGTLGSEYTQAFYRRWVGKTEPIEEPLLGTADIQSLADLGNSFEIIRKMRAVPCELSDFVGFLVPGLIPAPPLATTVMPLGEIVKKLMKLIV